MEPVAEETMVVTLGWSHTPLTEESEWSCCVNMMKGIEMAMVIAMIESIHHNAHARSILPPTNGRMVSHRVRNHVLCSSRADLPSS